MKMQYSVATLVCLFHSLLYAEYIYSDYGYLEEI
jgi:hypothetical protein